MSGETSGVVSTVHNRTCSEYGGGVSEASHQSDAAKPISCPSTPPVSEAVQPTGGVYAVNSLQAVPDAAFDAEALANRDAAWDLCWEARATQATAATATYAAGQRLGAQGWHDDAMALYREAKIVFEAVGATANPAYADLLRSMAAGLRRRGCQAEAAALYRHADELRKAENCLNENGENLGLSAPSFEGSHQQPPPKQLQFSPVAAHQTEEEGENSYFDLYWYADGEPRELSDSSLRGFSSVALAESMDGSCSWLPSANGGVQGCGMAADPQQLCCEEKATPGSGEGSTAQEADVAGGC